MKILLTGATGYIGKRLLVELISNDHDVVCCVRDRRRLAVPKHYGNRVSVIEVDFLKKDSLDHNPQDIDAAYYLMHSMASSRDYQKLELETASNFRKAIDKSEARQVIYLSGISKADYISSC